MPQPQQGLRPSEIGSCWLSSHRGASRPSKNGSKVSAGSRGGVSSISSKSQVEKVIDGADRA